VADAVSSGLSIREREELREARRREEGRAVEQRGGSPWADPEWIECRDGKRRPTQPGIFPLADGIPTRMEPDGTIVTPSRAGMLRGYGNAIVTEVAVTFIRAAMDALDEIQNG
jgi:DNA (cytosine-5)-methyltransferase 1